MFKPLRAIAALFAVILILSLSGCFPIELDVRDGKLLITRQEGFFIYHPATKKVTRLRGTEDGEPAFARFSPDGKELLTVVKAKGGNSINGFDFIISPIGGGKGRSVYKAGNTTYVLFSPNSKMLAVSRMPETELGDEKKSGDKQAPQIDIVSVADGKSTVAARNVGPIFRWFSDNKRLLAIMIKDKKENENHFTAELSIIDVATGKATAVAALVGDKECHIDLAPDGSRALLVAYSAGKPGTALSTEDKPYFMSLFDIDLKTNAVTMVREKAKYGLYSPGGKFVLHSKPNEESFSIDGVDLWVTDARFKDPGVKIASEAYVAMAIGGEGTVYPGWVSEKQVFYFIQRATYGSTGKSVNLVVSDVDGKKKQVVQPLIDTKAFEDVQ